MLNMVEYDNNNEFTCNAVVCYCHRYGYTNRCWQSECNGYCISKCDFSFQDYGKAAMEMETMRFYYMTESGSMEPRIRPVPRWFPTPKRLYTIERIKFTEQANIQRLNAMDEVEQLRVQMMLIRAEREQEELEEEFENWNLREN